MVPTPHQKTHFYEKVIFIDLKQHIPFFLILSLRFYFNNIILLNLIKKNNIAVIYMIYPQESSIIYDYIDRNCFVEIKISNILNSYELQNCQDING